MKREETIAYLQCETKTAPRYHVTSLKVKCFVNLITKREQNIHCWLLIYSHFYYEDAKDAHFIL